MYERVDKKIKTIISRQRCLFDITVQIPRQELPQQRAYTTAQQ